MLMPEARNAAPPPGLATPEDEFGDLFEEAPVACIKEGFDSRFIRANRAARELLGLRPADVEGTLGISLTAPASEAQQKLHDAYDLLRRGGEVASLVIQLQRGDGGPALWVEWSSRPAVSGLYTRTMLVDITQRVLADRAKAALDLSLDFGGIGEWDLDLVNDTSCRSARHDRCFGYTEPIPENDWGVAAFIRHVHPDDREQVKRSFALAVASHTDWSDEFHVVWPDGSVHALIAKGRVYRSDSSGRAMRMLGIVMDVTARKRVEEALVASEQLAFRQVEVLTHTLDSLAAEAAPDRLAEHVLRTLAGQLGAQSCSVWLRDHDSGLFDLQSTLEGSTYMTRGDLATQGVSLRIPMDEFWREDIQAGQISIMEDIRSLRNTAWRARLMALGVITVLMVPMFLGGKFDGTIGVRFTRKRDFRRAELDLAKALANQTMLALQLSRLSKQAREAAVVAERNRMAREIHDTLAQGFTGVIVQLEAAADAVSKGLRAEADTHIERAKEVARESLREARHSVRALRPQELQSSELAEAVEALIRKTTAGTTVVAQFLLTGEPRRLPPAWEENSLRIVQEALTNMLRHAGASRFTAGIEFAAHEVRICLADDGCGYDPSQKREGFGLLGIGERVAEMGGALAINTQPGAGVTLTVVLPFARDTPSAGA